MRHPRSLWFLLVVLLAACGGRYVQPGDDDVPSTGDGGVRDGEVYDGGVWADGSSTGCTAPDGRFVPVGYTESDGCNSCYCQPDGLFACTERACYDGGPFVDVPPTWDGGRPDSGTRCYAPNGQVLTPGQTAYDYARCVGYVCNPDGSVSTTRIACRDGGLVDAGGTYCRLPNGGVISQGQSWSDGCNSCYCGYNGQLSCTGIACYDAGPRPDAATYCRLPTGVVITPGQSYYDGCNTCTCLSNGSLACTERACPVDAGPAYDAGGYCIAPDDRLLRPGETWYGACEYCVCGPDGQLRCSYERCYDAGPPPPPPPPPPPFCYTPDGRVLTPGQSWSDGCNSCYCGYDGMLSCTGRACYDAGPPPPPPPPDAGQQCNSIPLPSNTPYPSSSPGPMPSAAGGTLIDGYYLLRAVTAYNGQPPPVGLGPTALRLTGGVLDIATRPTYSMDVNRSTYWQMHTGAQLTVVGVCGNTSMPTTMGYTATRATLELFVPANNTVMLFYRTN